MPTNIADWIFWACSTLLALFLGGLYQDKIVAWRDRRAEGKRASVIAASRRQDRITAAWYAGNPVAFHAQVVAEVSSIAISGFGQGVLMLFGLGLIGSYEYFKPSLPVSIAPGWAYVPAMLVFVSIVLSLATLLRDLGRVERYARLVRELVAQQDVWVGLMEGVRHEDATDRVEQFEAGIAKASDPPTSTEV